MTTNEYRCVLDECRERIVGKRIDKFRKVRDNLYRIKIGESEYIIEPGVRFHPTKYIEKTEDKDNLCEKISKEIGNSKVNSIEQINEDRIIEITTNQGSLILEMFGKGNIILVKEGKIAGALKNEKWADREIKPHANYIPPKGGNKKIEFDDKYVIVSILKAPIGKEYAKAVLSSLKIDEKTSGTKINDEERRKILEEVGQISDPKNKKPTAVIEKEGEIVEFYTTDRCVREGEKKYYEKFVEAADDYYFKYKKVNPEIEKLENRLEKQLQRKEELENEAKEFKKIGDWIYENQELIEGLIRNCKNTKGIEEMEKKGYRVNKKDKKIELEV